MFCTLRSRPTLTRSLYRRSTGSRVEQRRSSSATTTSGYRHQRLRLPTMTLIQTRWQPKGWRSPTARRTAPRTCTSASASNELAAITTPRWQAGSTYSDGEPRSRGEPTNRDVGPAGHTALHMVANSDDGGLSANAFHCQQPPGVENPSRSSFEIGIGPPLVLDTASSPGSLGAACFQISVNVAVVLSQQSSPRRSSANSAQGGLTPIPYVDAGGPRYPIFRRAPLHGVALHNNRFRVRDASGLRQVRIGGRASRLIKNSSKFLSRVGGVELTCPADLAREGLCRFFEGLRQP